jgi:UDP-3-O-[3-hydroxymyristoyl] glucosamine N-acyltransferase
MADKHFFKNTGPYTIAVLIERCNLRCDDSVDKEMNIVDVAALDAANDEQLSFLDNVKYKEALTKTKAKAVIVHPDMASFVPEGVIALYGDEPYKSYTKVATLFYPQSVSHTAGGQLHKPKIDETARIHSSAKIGKNCDIGAYCVISENAVIGDNCKIESFTHIHDGCVVGDNCHIGTHVSLYFTQMGNNVRVHNGARIGQDGFGFAFTETGFLPVPQLGRVVINDHVNIGANTTIDRGSGPDTIIGAGTIIDNLVQIAHNVQIGQGCIIVAQVGISGSTKIGNYCVFAGQVGVAGHLNIGDGVRVGAQSGVSKSVQAGTEIMGSPAHDKRIYWRELATLRRLSNKKTNKNKA